MSEKRPFPGDGLDDGHDSKRPRSAQASPAPDNDVERKRREVAERIAAMKARMANKGGPAATASAAAPAAAPPSSSATDMQARIAAMKARLQGNAAPASPSPAPASQQPTQTDIPTRPAAQAPGFAQSPPVRDDTAARARGGLNVGLHPSLLGGPSRSGNNKKQKEEPVKQNPYLTGEDQTAAMQTEPFFDPSLQKQKERKSKQLLFNQKGKFMAQAEALRQQARIEQMAKEMQEQARKKAIEEATEKSFLVPAPPDIEWWDEGLVTGGNYDNLEAPNKINMEVITRYVQHPVLLSAPQDANVPAPKAMYLTKQEQKKVRRQRRMADHKEEQAKIRLGLKAPPPPKVKKSNLMRVLGNEAVKDPTAVEARVNREIAQRAEDHETANSERQLTKEQRLEKLAAQQEADAALGMKLLVFKIDNLSYGKHRFQINKNAEQQALTGITIFHPKMNLVIVEGGSHSINAYKKLMLNRVKWTENAMPQSVREGNTEANAAWLNAFDEDGKLKDNTFNRCQLVFEGEEKQRSFKRWMPYKACETDGEAKDVLSRYKMENMWTLAQSPAFQ
ncbi:U4/U6 small nuclear ribonucleoprotein Prp3 [Aureobasidium melanogenum CBS 110374]|uniref:U4/U6 small nuclear ribonucleo protein Prp3 n=1 Tax=Aureobasidium melanogenum (strain CBS 110374) TaxID=1043003 RepID=A0A074WZC2_AURM1|nr:U4/U6 small nuclear ribonucleoprotein Prp3 [Aureobasidium melanogenum CBS 110374]KEQ67746.1 U4/U6 small nuclear ribonucleo protein Prp3 [Aureobasidium melanogenum CBS 110374]